MPDYVISVDLQKHINAIKLADGRAKKAVFEIAWRLAEIADEQNGLLDGTGYNNIVELAADQFGYARSTTLNYVKIANRYLTCNTKEIRTICAELDDGGKATADYKVGQLNALPGNVDRDEFKRLDTAGIINKDMSADKIKQALKDYYNPQSDPEPEPDPDDTGDSTEQGEQGQIPCLTLPVFQILLNIVNPITDDFCAVTDPEPETAMYIFKEFFRGTGYALKWLTDPEDDEIIGAEMRDSSGNLLYTTNQEV